MSNWPSDLPQALLINGFKESTPDVVLRSKMGYGADKTRPLVSNAPRPVSGQQMMTPAQVASLDTFYMATIGKTAPFTWKNPRTGVSCSMRFVSPPEWTRVENKYLVALSLEIMP